MLMQRIIKAKSLDKNINMFPVDHTSLTEVIHWDGVCFPVMSTARRELHLSRALVYDRLGGGDDDDKSCIDR